MLILRRKAGQLLKIGDDIEVRVLRVSKGRVRLGIEAPDDVRVVRAETDFFQNSFDEESQVNVGSEEHFKLTSLIG